MIKLVLWEVNGVVFIFWYLEYEVVLWFDFKVVGKKFLVFFVLVKDGRI